jgi:cation diffusion facilitator CzcD-associated flavoprotein CzcO
MCDVESFCYMPLCEELGYVPTEKYAHQPELLRHSQAIMAYYGLYDTACLGAEVSELRWAEEDGRWHISTDRGDQFHARFATVNFGVFSHPKLPATTVVGAGVEMFEVGPQSTPVHYRTARCCRWTVCSVQSAACGG